MPSAAASGAHDPPRSSRHAGARPGPARLHRTGCRPAADRLWLADSTHVPTEQEGFLSLVVILDVFSRRVGGWPLYEQPRTELVLAALEMALWNRRPAVGLIQHSDHGCQYTSLRFGQRCQAAGIRSSMGTVRDCYDNAMMESVFATLECELLATNRFRTHAQAWLAVFEWIEVFHTRQRCMNA